jgi:hypothetical protein
MNRTSATLLVAAALSCSGCLDFDRQTIHAIFPEGRDELHVVLIYEGLHVNGTEKKDTTQAQLQLKELVEGQSFYVGNHMLRFSLVEKNDDKLAKQLQALLFKHLEIANGVLFLDDKSSLNGCQTVRIRNLSAFVTGLNQVIAAEFARLTEEKRGNLTADDFHDLETLALIDRAIQEKHVWLKCEPGRISFTMPASDAVIVKVKRTINGADRLARLDAQAQEFFPRRVPDMRKALADATREQQALADLPWSFQQGRKQFTISLGVGVGEPLHLPISSRTRLPAWEGDLVNYARNAQLPVRKDLTSNGLIEKLQRDVKELGK